MTHRGVVWALVLVGSFWGAAPARSVGEERHYVLIFGAEPTPKRIKDCHTWGTFVRVVGEGADPSGYQVFAHAISFVPATLQVRTFALKAEPALNLDLEASLAYTRRKGASVTMWGPFLIRPDVYRKSLEVWSVVESGQAEYRAIDSLCDLLIADCIHAVAAVDPKFGRAHYPLIFVGKAASRYMAYQVVERTDPDRTRPDASWLIPVLGLDRYPIEFIAPRQMPRRLRIFGSRDE